jgi:hypothetical protein
MRHSLTLIAFTAGAHACSSHTSHIPEQRASATLGGRSAATYALSSEHGQQGSLRLSSFGTAKLKQRGGGDSSTALHLRMAVADYGDELIVLDTRAQRLRLPDGQEVAPAHVRSEAGAVPALRVMPGKARLVDLYFALPPGLLDEARVSGFDVLWRVRVGDQTVARTTPFERTALDPAVARQELTRTLDRMLDRPEPIIGPDMGGGPDVATGASP